MIPIRSPQEIDAIARAGAVVSLVLDRLLSAALPGVTTAHLDSFARTMLQDAGAVPLFPGTTLPQRPASPPFPAAICTCINDEVTHGVPGHRALAIGDLLCLDLGASLAGWCADASRAIVVGQPAPNFAPRTTPSDPTIARRLDLLHATLAASDAGIDLIAPGVRWSTIADAIRHSAANSGFRVVAGFSGHGIGRALHEPPSAPMHLGPKDDFVLHPGMVLTVEPILVSSPPARAAPAAPELPGVALVTRPDGWTVATADGSDACQIEHTVAVVRGGVRVLTRAGKPGVGALESPPSAAPV